MYSEVGTNPSRRSISALCFPSDWHFVSSTYRLPFPLTSRSTPVETVTVRLSTITIYFISLYVILNPG